jgi:hypothetical protein
VLVWPKMDGGSVKALIEHKIGRSSPVKGS